ncbi:hypothetical protein MA16_Dca022191 [Dendrobium catenatum]|uniref:Uncharacterized protein n=1 Tax=Dendrobium catenatum TaxID=906689 RepID=A0A2I0VGI1_9ASPA|nr:hypothetical protein MA16_Dca022191 [Dendrobium catenatum]
MARRALAVGEVPCADELAITGCGAEAGPGNAGSAPLGRDGSEAAVRIAAALRPDSDVDYRRS